MKNFLYKLIFPESGKLYIGRATNETRYPNNSPNHQFLGPHHNIEVQNLLDSKEFCYFHVVKIFKTTEELEFAEDDYLKKVWKSDTWESRPKWLLNRNRSSKGGLSGDLHHRKTLEGKQKLSKDLARQWEEGLRQHHKSFCGKTWDSNDPRRGYDLNEVTLIVKQQLEEHNYSYHWGRRKLAEQLGLSEVTLKRIALNLKESKND